MVKELRNLLSYQSNGNSSSYHGGDWCSRMAMKNPTVKESDLRANMTCSTYLTRIFIGYVLQYLGNKARLTFTQDRFFSSFWDKSAVYQTTRKRLANCVKASAFCCWITKICREWAKKKKNLASHKSFFSLELTQNEFLLLSLSHHITL